jgi:DNA polymerase-1
MPIQGTAADIIKRAMISIHVLIRDKPEIRMILQVHDELVLRSRKAIRMRQSGGTQRNGERIT